VARHGDTASFDDGAVLMGGSPLRLLRISARAKALLEQWEAGSPVGESMARRLLARRLVSAGVVVPRVPDPTLPADAVTVVIPVRDRPEQLGRLLSTLSGLACVVVDDGSAQASLTKEIADLHQATFIGLPVNLGPSAARNAGLAAVHSPLVAFVDSDCIPTPGWLAPLLGHFEDPMVAAVAPRVVPAPTERPTALSRYEAVGSSLDRGSVGGLVRPLSRIPYLPSAALVVRRQVAVDRLFDPRLRGGEDVDLVWRLVDAGWDVRYEPAGIVEHGGPSTLAAFVSRRAFYGSTAGPLSTRHPAAMAPVSTSAWSAIVWAGLVARRPFLAATALIASVLVLAHRLTGLVRQPVKVATQIAGGGTTRSAVPALSGLARTWSPLFVAGLGWRRTRLRSALALLIPALDSWRQHPDALDPVRFCALHVADDIAYGTGVWVGCLGARTIRPLLPRVALRSRVWSSGSLRTHLSEPAATDPDQP
jgi:mycofactocin system glycosyltransferase